MKEGTVAYASLGVDKCLNCSLFLAVIGGRSREWSRGGGTVMIDNEHIDDALGQRSPERIDFLKGGSYSCGAWR